MIIDDSTSLFFCHTRLHAVEREENLMGTLAEPVDAAGEATGNELGKLNGLG